MALICPLLSIGRQDIIGNAPGGCNVVRQCDYVNCQEKDCQWWVVTKEYPMGRCAVTFMDFLEELVTK